MVNKPKKKKFRVREWKENVYECEDVKKFEEIIKTIPLKKWLLFTSEIFEWKATATQ